MMTRSSSKEGIQDIQKELRHIYIGSGKTRGDFLEWTMGDREVFHKRRSIRYFWKGENERFFN